MAERRRNRRILRSWRQVSDVLTRRPRVVEALSANDDYTDNLSDVPDLLRARRPAFVGTQESKRDNLARITRQALGWRYGVRQDRDTTGSAGVAVVWDRLIARPVGEAVDNPEERGGGWMELTPPGSGLMARGVVWQDLRVRVGWVHRATIRLASAHRPPGRDKHLWPTFDGRLTTWCKESPYPLLILMDANEDGGPAALIAGSGLSWHGVGIDGALTSLRSPGEPEALARHHSDHRAVSIPVRL